MKSLLPYQILIFLAPLCSLAQNSTNWRTVTDALVSEADSLALKSQVTFHLEKFLKADESYKETWHYTEKKGKVVFFQIHYMIESTEFTESYYLNGTGSLICMEQVQAPFAHYYVDEVLRGERYFLVENIVKEHVSFGKQKFDPKYYPDASMDLVDRFTKRYDELVKNKDELNSLRHSNNN